MKHAEHQIFNHRCVRSTLWSLGMLCVCISFAGGCSLVPEARVRDTLHNPFPQLKRVAVLPFFNQSDQPNVDGNEVAKAYYAALQAVPGFEVMPVGVTAAQLRVYSMQFGEPRNGAEFQQLAKALDVEAVVVGSVTDFDSYYPPRIAMTVRWYAANEGFHMIPPGYGLAWGTDGEEKIPARIVREAEFELARSQMKTQTPQPISPMVPIDAATRASTQTDPFDDSNPLRSKLSNPVPAMGIVRHVDHEDHFAEVAEHQIVVPGVHANVESMDDMWDEPIVREDGGILVEGIYAHSDEAFAMDGMPLQAPLPPQWPNPTDLIPDPPAMTAPPMIVTHEPVLTHTRLYRADDPYFTQRLADHVETGDDARGTSWQGYIKRSEDFIRFCCHLHITEMLESRGGRDESDLILRWPVSRY